MRRFRTLLAAALVAAVVLVPAAGAVSAQEGEESHNAVEDVIHEAEENGASHADAECIEILAEGGTVEDCQEAPNPLLPEPNEIIWGAIGFIIVFLFLWKFGLPAIKQGMNARTEKIRSDIEQAEALRAEAEQVLARYNAQLAEAKAEAARIIEEARQSAEAMKRDLQAQAEADIAAQRQKASADIEAAKAQALADLRNEVANIAIGAAERVVERNLDAATNTALVESFIDQVGAGRS